MKVHYKKSQSDRIHTINKVMRVSIIGGFAFVYTRDRRIIIKILDVDRLYDFKVVIEREDECQN